VYKTRGWSSVRFGCTQSSDFRSLLAVWFMPIESLIFLFFQQIGICDIFTSVFLQTDPPIASENRVIVQGGPIKAAPHCTVLLKTQTRNV